MRGPDRLCRDEPLVREGGGHSDGDDRDVGLVAVDMGEQVGGVSNLGDDVEAFLGQEAGESLSDHARVVGENDAQGGFSVLQTSAASSAHGISAWSRVP